MTSDTNKNEWQEYFVGSGGYRDGVYDDQPNPVLTPFDQKGQVCKYGVTLEKTSSVWAWWTPKIAESGLYDLEIYVPTEHATTRNARYHLHGVSGKEDFVVPITQADFPGEWVTLGAHELDVTKSNPGRVNLNNMTGEADKEIAFTGIRWRKSVPVKSSESPEETEPGFAKTDANAGVNLADGFASPVGVGTAGELGADGLWLDAAKEPLRSEWYMSTDYNQRYKDSSGDAAIHTGVDLNLNPKGQWNKDKGQPVYAIASGIVTYADLVKRYWGHIVVIQHDPMEAGGAFVVSRVGHLAKVFVTAGQRIERGHKIGTVGSNLDVNGKSVGNEHLHFDISPTLALVNKPTDWPGLDQGRITRDYIDPKAFIRDHRPK